MDITFSDDAETWMFRVECSESHGARIQTRAQEAGNQEGCLMGFIRKNAAEMSRDDLSLLIIRVGEERTHRV